MILFLDASSCLELFVNGPHRSYVRDLTQQVFHTGGAIALSGETYVAVSFALADIRFSVNLSPAAYRLSVETLKRRVETGAYTVVKTDGRVYELAALLQSSRRWGTHSGTGHGVVYLDGAVVSEKEERGTEGTVGRHRLGSPAEAIDLAHVALAREDERGRADRTGAGPEEVLILTFRPSLHTAAVAEGLAHANPVPDLEGGLTFEGISYA